ncbi:MAG: serine hydrolase domain-containing protein [Marinirhabdus sp.]|nr:serine hydrolase domain-containing protein [Marinirhabdus sp.]
MKQKIHLSILFFLIFQVGLNAQILKKIKKVAGTVTNSISLDKLSRDPVTTNFNDVNNTKYLSNDFGNDVVYKNIHDQPYDWEKGFFLSPGFYEGRFQSFCIKAGTYTPRKGNGRFYAKLKGPKADIVAAIIEGFQTNPEVSQRDAQLLLWAIIAKTDFQKMKGPIKITALKLLTTNQIARLSKGALEEYATNKIESVARKNETLRSILNAENNLRQKYYAGIHDYSQYEEIAMRTGVEPVLNGYDLGRWTKHPEGFFIRYFVKGYSETITQIYVPENDIEAYQPIKGNGPSMINPVTTINGKYYKSRNSIATPPDDYSQRIIQSDIEVGSSGGSGSNGSSGGSNGNNGNGGNGGSSGNTGNDGSAGDGGNNGSGGNDGNSGSGGNGANGNGANGNGGNSGGLPGDEKDKNPFPCETVIHPIADATIKLDMRNQNIPGVLVAIFKGDSIIHMQAYGKMRFDKKLTLNTQLQWASVSKSVTGVAALQMIEDGRISLDEKASDVVSNWPQEQGNIKAENGIKYIEDRYKKISLRNLLNNTSGIQHYGFGRDNSTTTQYGDITFKFVHGGSYSPRINGGWNAKSSVEQFNKSILDFHPGKDYLYSSYGFNLAGAMIDSKISYGYDDWVIKYIKNRLGLKSFSIARNVANRYGYQYGEDGILNSVALADHDDVLPAGGWESTICDLATYTRALSRGELLNDHEALWDERNMHISNAKAVRGYGLGVKRRGINDTLRVYHGGTNTGSRAYIHFFPSDTTGIVMMAPFKQAELERLASNLLNDLGLRKNFYTTRTQPLDRCRRGMKDGKDMFTGIWRKSAKKQLIRTGLSKQEFLDEIRIMRDEYGYHLADVEAHMTDDKQIVYDGVFKKGRKIQIFITELDVFQFRQETSRLKEQGLAITEFEYVPLYSGVQKSDKIGFAAILEKNAPVADYRQFNDVLDLMEFAEQQGPGSNIRIIDVEIHPTKNGVLCTALYVQGTPTVLRNDGLTSFMEGFQQGAFSALGNPLDIDLYTDGNDLSFRRYISLWDPSDKNDYRTSFMPAKQPALSFCSVMEMHEANRNDGYELVDMDRLFFIVDK